MGFELCARIIFGTALGTCLERTGVSGGTVAGQSVFGRDALDRSLREFGEHQNMCYHPPIGTDARGQSPFSALGNRGLTPSPIGTAMPFTHHFKPSHKEIKTYYDDLAAYARHEVSHEGHRNIVPQCSRHAPRAVTVALDGLHAVVVVTDN
jgi:hypothetical protein